VRRRYLHEKIALALERFGADDYDQFVLPLAHHVDCAGIPERALPYVRRAGMRAMRLSASEQAVEHFSHAIALADRLPGNDAREQTEAELQLHLAIALSALRGFSAPEVERDPRQVYGAHDGEQANAAAVSDSLRPLGLPRYPWQLPQVKPYVDRMMAVASAQDDEILTLQALHARWPDAVLRGRLMTRSRRPLTGWRSTGLTPTMSSHSAAIIAEAVRQVPQRGECEFDP
jgi:hypothetical protein